MPYISMSQKDLNRYDVIKRAIRKEITVKKAGELLHLSKRQIYPSRPKNRVLIEERLDGSLKRRKPFIIRKPDISKSSLHFKYELLNFFKN